MGFEKAKRAKAKLRMALAGPSGSGKTLSALRLAKGMAQVLKVPIALIDTEKRSSELYAGVLKAAGLPEGWQVDFDVLPFNPPFPPQKYVKGIKLAESEGYGILIIDSLSHAWNGEGGILEMVDAWTAADKYHNSFAAWKKATPIQNELLNAILQSDLHIIATMRSKVAWEITKDDRTGKNRPEKVGLAPVQRADLDYEFTTWLDLSVDGHVATAGKDRTNLFDAAPRVLTEETGVELLKWLNEGE